jgi:hypothetical protein
MPKFKILVTMDKLSGEYVIEGEEWSHKHFESRAEAQEAYHALIAKLEGEVNRVQETLDAVVEHGHIVEVE